MFRHVPACSGMFRVPGFIDGHAKLQTRNCGLRSAVCGLPDAKGL